MYTPKTKQTETSVLEALKPFETEKRYSDLLELLDLMQKISGETPKIWGNGMIGFGKYAYQGKSSKGEWFKMGFSPRKQNISIHMMSGFDTETDLMEKLGKYKTGKSCLYVKRLEDLDKDTFTTLLNRSHEKMKDW